MTSTFFNRFIFRVLSAIVLISAMTSCLGKDDEDYSDWREKNTKYVADVKDSPEGGESGYVTIVPDFAPKTFILMKWHNDRKLTEKNLSPLDNSTVDCKYICRDIENTLIDTSFLSTTYGDSIYRTKPTDNIAGFWAALVNMHVGDSVTVVIPYDVAYGSVKYGNIKPYSTLIYDIKLKSIPALERPE